MSFVASSNQDLILKPFCNCGFEYFVSHLQSCLAIMEQKWKKMLTESVPALKFIPQNIIDFPYNNGQYNFKKSLDIDAFVDLYDSNPGGRIGEGGFGKVYSGVRIDDGRAVAIKCVQKNKIKKWVKPDHILMPLELVFLFMLTNHCCIIEVLDWCESKETIKIIMERPERAIDLCDYIQKQGRLRDEEARFIFKQIIYAVHYAHMNGVVHRDIKEQNIILNQTSGEIKIIDFGCGTFFQENHYRDFAGTHLYYPPEWFNLSYYKAEPAAVWSLGVVLYSMVCGDIPFHTTQEIAEGRLQFKTALSNDLERLIGALLNRNPNLRPRLIQIMNHPWLHVN